MQAVASGLHWHKIGLQGGEADPICTKLYVGGNTGCNGKKIA